jgi:hypothetical protein
MTQMEYSFLLVGLGFFVGMILICIGDFADNDRLVRAGQYLMLACCVPLFLRVLIGTVLG